MYLINYCILREEYYSKVILEVSNVTLSLSFLSFLVQECRAVQYHTETPAEVLEAIELKQQG